MKRPIFEKYGGFARVSQIVMSFYDRILDSPVTRPYFANIDMRRMIDHQTKFISSVMGGPASFTNDHLERVHTPHHISEEAFVEAVDLLRETLEDHGFEDEDVYDVVQSFMVRKHFIVTRGERVDA
jgi:hemoglobin